MSDRHFISDRQRIPAGQRLSTSDIPLIDSSRFGDINKNEDLKKSRQSQTSRKEGTESGGSSSSKMAELPKEESFRQAWPFCLERTQRKGLS
jgi:hypothetical protein